MPKEIGSLINLTHLNCSYTKIKELPKEIGSLINLTIFNCSNTQITGLLQVSGSARITNGLTVTGSVNIQVL